MSPCPTYYKLVSSVSRFGHYVTVHEFCSGLILGSMLLEREKSNSEKKSKIEKLSQFSGTELRCCAVRITLLSCPELGS